MKLMAGDNFENPKHTAARLRRMADDIEAWRTIVLSSFTNLNLIETTKPGDMARSFCPDHTSYLMLIRYQRTDREEKEVKTLVRHAMVGEETPAGEEHPPRYADEQRWEEDGGRV